MMQRARQFTEAAGDAWPTDGPQVMTLQEVDFLCKMVVDEMLEMYATVTDPEDAKTKLTEHVKNAKTIEKEPFPTPESQADAAVDIMYYIVNAAAKKGMDLDAVFDEVHQANMRKADPKTGKFVRREDGKVLKPDNWTPPDVGKALRRRPNDTRRFLETWFVVAVFLGIAMAWMKSHSSANDTHNS